MINAAMLEAASVEQLQELKRRVTEILDRKARMSVTYGATFEFFGGGRTVRIKVTGQGPKNVMGLEVNERGTEVFPQRRWRVSPELLRPWTPTQRTPLRSEQDRPASAMADAF